MTHGCGGEALFFQQDASCMASRRRGANSKLPMKGRFGVQLWRQGRFYQQLRFPNDITNEGKNLLFEVMFHDGSQIASSSWFIGLISLASYSALAPTDTMASHSGWTEFTSYSQTARVLWGPGAASGQTITNASAATFDITASGTVKGVFIASNNAKNGTTGKLWATALFTADVPVVNTDQLRITYSVSA